MSWLTYAPEAEDLPHPNTFKEAGFPDRAIRTTKADVSNTVAWSGCMDWWEKLDTHLTIPRGLAIWDTEPKAWECLNLLAFRLSFWHGLPVGRGVRVAPAAYVEAVDLFDDSVALATRSVGTLVVAGAGAIMYSADRTLEVLTGIAKLRQRNGCLTLWHLSPAATLRSVEVCRRLVAVLGESVMVVGEPPVPVEFGGVK